MNKLNIEIKAKCINTAFVRNFLQKSNARFIGTDYQTDTYFNVSSGRLKLRQGNIENALIFYKRNNDSGPKQSDVQLFPVTDAESLKMILLNAVGIKVVVEKKREIYFIEHVKFHIDEINDLGSFVEIEVICPDEKTTKEEMQKTCNTYMNDLQIQTEDLITVSYSDMLLQKL